MDHPNQPEPTPLHAARFPTTHWSMVARAAGQEAGAVTGHTREALARLCESYWFPLYAFLRRTGYSAEDGQDLTQGFFARLLAQHSIARVDREKGKFRTFLLGALKHFLADQRRWAGAQKRGGRCVTVSFDQMDAETRYRLEPAQGLTPEQMFEKQWALALLDRVLARLAGELAAAGKTPLFEGLKETLTGVSSAHYAELAARLNLSPGAVKVAVYRLRRRYRDLLREEIAQTLGAGEDIDEEIHYLMACL